MTEIPMQSLRLSPRQMAMILIHSFKGESDPYSSFRRLSDSGIRTTIANEVAYCGLHTMLNEPAACKYDKSLVDKISAALIRRDGGIDVE